MLYILFILRAFVPLKEGNVNETQTQNYIIILKNACKKYECQ